MDFFFFPFHLPASPLFNDSFFFVRGRSSSWPSFPPGGSGRGVRPFSCFFVRRPPFFFFPLRYQLVISLKSTPFLFFPPFPFLQSLRDSPSVIMAFFSGSILLKVSRRFSNRGVSPSFVRVGKLFPIGVHTPFSLFRMIFFVFLQRLGFS